MSDRQIQLVDSNGKPIDVTGGRLHVTSSSVVIASINVSMDKMDDAVIGVGATVSTTGIMIGGTIESTVPTEGTDGKFGALQLNTFLELVIAGLDKAQNALGTVDKDPFSAKSGYEQLIDVTLDADPTSYTSAWFFIGDKQKVSFEIRSNVDWTDSNPDLAVVYTFETSPDASDAYTFDCLMAAGGEDAPVASITHTSGGDSDLITEATAYLPDGFTSQYIRVVATGSNTDADDVIAVDVILEWKKG